MPPTFINRISDSGHLAAKRRKNAAHGASRGEKWETGKPQQTSSHAHTSSAAVSVFF
ncbi:hypothetical protein SBA2_1140005 [Acidobacteriia bacterium SbA2]|nr:hypothetical protein SBA2_1140005 [Acidobacteriia bacterium SbA2]